MSNHISPSAQKIFKFNKQRELMHVYEKQGDAIKTEHLHHLRLKEVIANGELWNDHYYSNSNPLVLPDHTHAGTERSAWETASGLFNIEGWGRVCI